MTRILLALLLLAGAANAQVVQTQSIPASQATGGVTVANLVCDNATDNSALLQAAITTASTTPRNTVYFPPASSSCLLLAPVTVSASVRFWAYPGSVTLAPKTGNAGAQLLFLVSGTSDVRFHGITFDGGGVDFANSAALIKVTTSSRVEFDETTFQNSNGRAILADTSVVGLDLHDSALTNIGNHWITTQLTADRREAVLFTEATPANSYGSSVMRNRFTSIGLDAVSITGQTNFISGYNICNLANGQTTATWTNPQPTAFGACIYGGASNGSITSTNEEITGAQGNGVDFASGDLTLGHDTITGSGSAGMGIFTTGSVSITGGTLTNNGQWASATWVGGISLHSALKNVSISGVTASDNQGSQTQQYGVQVAAGSTWNSLSIDPSNSLTGNKIAAIGGIVNDFTSGGTKDNRISNPCFAVDQRLEGGTYPHGGGTVKIVDQWEMGQSANAFTLAREAASYNGCQTGLLLTADGSVTPGAGDIYRLFTQTEGASVQDLNFGTALASPIMLEFQAKTSCAGTYSFVLKTGASARYYAHQFALAANTLTQVSVPILGDTGGSVIPNTTGYGFNLFFNLGTGSSGTGTTADAWTAGSIQGITSDTKFVSCAAASTYRISAVRIYPGTGHLPFVQLPQAETFAGLRRFYRKTFPPGTAPVQNGGVAGSICTKNPIALGDPSAFWQFEPPMRITPTVTTYNPSVANANWRDVTAGADVTVSVDPATALSSQNGVLIATSGTVATLGDVICIQAAADAE